MKMRRRYLLLGLAMGSGLVGAEALRPGRPPASDRPPLVLETAVPASFGSWRIDPRSMVIAPVPDAQAQLDKIYDQVLARTYVNGEGRRIMLSVAYGGAQTDELKAHRQEVCYAAQGFEIRDLHASTIHIAGRAVRVTRMYALNQSRSEPVTYWFTMGNRVVGDALNRLASQLRFALLGEIPDGLLVRISDLSRTPAESYVRHEAFAAEMLAAVGVELHERFVGTL